MTDDTGEVREHVDDLAGHGEDDGGSVFTGSEGSKRWQRGGVAGRDTEFTKVIMKILNNKNCIDWESLTSEQPATRPDRRSSGRGR